MKMKNKNISKIIENCFSETSLKTLNILSSKSPSTFLISYVEGIGCMGFTLPV